MRRVLLAVSLLAVTASVGCVPSGGKAADTNDPACQIDSNAEHGPGWPFDLNDYESKVLPALVTNCSASGCHGAPMGNAGFTVWADAAVGNCSYAKTFNGLKAFVDLTTPANSQLVAAVRGDDPNHPVKLSAGDPTLTLLTDYVAKASANAQSDLAPPGASPYDYTVFKTVIQPILDTADGKGCAGANCHGSAAGINGFRVAVVSADQAAAILDWITKAKQNSGGNGNGCVPGTTFDAAVFKDDIEPILFGDVVGTTGCALTACHGADRSGGALVLKTTNTPEQNLQNLACFVNLDNPVSSEILACPLNQAPCRHLPHPGQDVFQGATDPSFQRVLSFLYSAKTGATPLDFAFYARRVNPIFNDVGSVQGGAQNRTCADTVSCHGVSAAGQHAPNGSNFPIIANLTDAPTLEANFSAAANFANFLDPRGSSLFMYPTNEIANLQNPFATGLPHPGGLDFAVDSNEARAILTWARGLRPDGQGFIKYWLVAGDYSATLITTPTLITESTVAPKIFDPDGAAQFNEGQWDALLIDDKNAVDVDLGAEFPRAQNSGRVAYAVAPCASSSTAWRSCSPTRRRAA
jgi:hypothetical protein